MTSKKIILTDKAPAPVGPYSQGVQAGQFLYVAGQVPMNPQTKEIIKGNIQEATKQVMENIKAIVEQAGYNMIDIVRCRVYLKNMDDFGAMNEIYGAYFPEKPPASVAFQATRLRLDVDVEISATAWKE